VTWIGSRRNGSKRTPDVKNGDWIIARTYLETVASDVTDLNRLLDRLRSIDRRDVLAPVINEVVMKRHTITRKQEVAG